MSTPFFEQAVARHGNGNVSAAESLYRKAIENNEQRNSASFNLTLYIRPNNRPAAAKPLLLEVIDSAPVDGAAYATLRKILFDEGANQKAQQLLERAIQLEPENVDAILSLAEAMLLDEQFSEVIERLENCLAAPDLTGDGR